MIGFHLRKSQILKRQKRFDLLHWVFLPRLVVNYAINIKENLDFTKSKSDDRKLAVLNSKPRIVAISN